MADASNTYGDIGNRTAGYAAAKMLEHARPHILLGDFGDTKELPMHKTATIKFRRPVPFAKVSTPLSEGIPPTSVRFSYEDVEATIMEYGNTTPLTNQIADLSEDPVLADMTELMGENAGASIEEVCWGVVKGGTNVVYTGAVSARASLVSTLSDGAVETVIRGLKSTKGMEITKRVSASTNVATEPVPPAYVAFAHTDLEQAIRALTGFVEVERYGQYQPAHMREIGKKSTMRFMLSADLTPIADAGGTAGTSWLSTTGTSADVYPVICIAQHAYGHVPLRGKNAIRPIVINPRPSKTDPLGQNGSVSWHRRYAAVRLNELWMYRIETCAAVITT